MSFTMNTFPPELVEIIVHDIWTSEMPSFVRKSSMTTCPRINRTWKAVYAPCRLICTSPTSHFWTIYATFPGTENLSSTMILSPGLPVPLPASSTSGQINGKARPIVISLTYPISVVSKLCSNLFNIYPSRSFGWVWEKISYRYYHRSMVFLFESATTGSFPVMPPRTTTPGRRECVYIFP